MTVLPPVLQTIGQRNPTAMNVATAAPVSMAYRARSACSFLFFLCSKTAGPRARADEYIVYVRPRTTIAVGTPTDGDRERVDLRPGGGR